MCKKVKCKGVLISHINGQEETIFGGKRDKVDTMANAFEEEIGERHKRGKNNTAYEMPSSSSKREIPLPEEHHPKMPQQPRVKTEKELEMSRQCAAIAERDGDMPEDPYYLGYYYNTDSRYAQDNSAISRGLNVNNKIRILFEIINETGMRGVVCTIYPNTTGAKK